MRSSTYSRIKIAIVLSLTFTLWGYAGIINAQSLKQQTIKYQNLLALIDAFYVDTVNVEKLTEEAIVHVLSTLDPHSVYISSDEVKEMNEPLQGSFSGIGIQFNILRDTLMVVATIPGGPSEKVGLRAGDRIVQIDKENIAGVGLKNSGVRKRLRGEKGTVVTILVKRKNADDLFEFVIIRDDIPIYSLDASYMLDDKTGYIKLNRFSLTTFQEFYDALVELKKQKMENLILDFRSNGGGFMKAAIDIVDQMMDANGLIVYTKGLTLPRHDNYSTSRGIFKDGKVIVLIDEGSASASEIVAGAIQDWDRGLVIGRRSFGKGLVQRQFPLSDGSMVRLTTAHYYTPTGRCIQKPYNNGAQDYYMDIHNRYNSGEMTNIDSIHFSDSLKYKTLIKKRIVYGGGGIMPDIYMPFDTTRNFQYFNMLARKNVLYPFIVNYIDKNREQLRRKYSNFEQFDKNFYVDENMMANLVKEGEKAGVEKNDKDYKDIEEELKMRIKALLARDLWTTNEYFRIVNKHDEFLEKASQVLNTPGMYERQLQ